MCGASGYLLAALVPDVNPVAIAAREGVSRNAYHLTYVVDTERLDDSALYVVDAVPARVLPNEECASPANHIAHTTAGITGNLLPLGVIEIMPVLVRLDIGNLLLLRYKG